MSKKRCQCQSKRTPHIPDWAKHERQSDLAWIVENQHILWRSAQQQSKIHGRGAIVVDTMIQITRAGHPFAYYLQMQINEIGGIDAQRMVREYDPQNEMVIVLLKSQERLSVYRVQVL